MNIELKDNNLSLEKRGDKNGMWKGDEAEVGAIHDYVRLRKKKPEKCERCHERKAIDLANISGKYLRILSDWEYLCRKCHMDGDGRNEQLRQSGKSRKLPDKICTECGIVFHPDKRNQLTCSHKCGNKSMWKKRKEKL